MKPTIAKFGKSSTYSFVQFVEQGVDGNWMKQFSSNLFEFAYSTEKEFQFVSAAL